LKVFISVDMEGISGIVDATMRARYILSGVRLEFVIFCL
jgi:D-aminopeptidase